MGKGEFSARLFIVGGVFEFVFCFAGIGFGSGFEAGVDFFFGGFEDVFFFQEGHFGLAVAPSVFGVGGVGVTAGFVGATVRLGDAFEGLAAEGKAAHGAEDSGPDHQDQEHEGEGCRGVELHGAAGGVGEIFCVMIVAQSEFFELE